MQTEPQRIYIARHGQTDANQRGLIQGRSIDLPLNEEGERQTLRLTEWMKQRDRIPEVIVTSSLIRAQQTAIPLAKFLGIEVKTDARFDEMFFGDLDGTSAEQPTKEMLHCWKEWAEGNVGFATPNGESPLDVLTRAVEAWQELLATYPDKTILIVTHGRFLRIFLSHLTGIGLARMAEIPHSNTGVHIFNRWEHQLQCVALNATEHLH